MRTPIKRDSIIKLTGGNSYQIIGDPIGSGGGSLIYPAARVVQNKEGIWEKGSIRFALKECFPVTSSFSFARSDDGEIRPEGSGEEAVQYLERAREMQLLEEKITGAVYEKGFRLIPTLESAREVELSSDGVEFHTIRSAVTIMESLDQKGQSLYLLMKESRRLNAQTALKIIEQILLAVREVHTAGYLHLDIQDGNIFMRGTLEDESSLVSLIDFSAARKLEDDGKTAVIGDRVIYSTQGFTPPEILNKNDGSLRLGKEADIYEIGCLLVLLLTGHPINYERTYLSDGAKSIKPYEMKRTDCPAHLQERLNGLLTTALRNEPENRYHDCDGMLVAVRDLLDAMQSHKSAISQMDYDAFVCYRHSETDSAAAVALQRALERYKAPKSIGTKRTIGRVFVDEGELSSCADFGEQIREALKNAQWLVVVCSPQTKESPWVNLEIDTFLEYHDRSRILAVLTEGEPEESFPEELLKETEGEVFAADARGTTVSQIKKKIKGDALLRIAAPMLGTTFDSLKQRQKTYRVQRATAAATAALALLSGFTGYAVHQNRVLNKQYQETLMNESRLLAEEADKDLDNNDPLSAISKLIEALPTKESPRPYYPKARGYLEQALEVYSTPESNQLYPVATGIFQPGKKMDRRFYLDETGKYLFAREYNENRLYICESKTMNCVHEIKVNNTISCFDDSLINSDKQLIYLADNTYLSDQSNNIYCFSYSDGKEKWKDQVDGEIEALTLSANMMRLYLLQDDSLKILNAENGNIEKEISLDMVSLMPEGVMDFTRNSGPLAVSESGDRIAWAMTCIQREETIPKGEKYKGTDKWYKEYIAVMDMEDESIIVYPGDYHRIDQFIFTGEDKLIATGNTEFTETISDQGITIHNYNDNQTKAVCIDLEEHRNLWSTGFNQTGESNILTYYLSSKDAEDGIPRILLASGAHSQVINAITGESVSQYDLPYPITRAALEDNGEPVWVLYNGDYALVSEGKMSSVEDYVADGILQLIRYKGNLYAGIDSGEQAALSTFVTSRAVDKIIKYDRKYYDTNLREIAALDLDERLVSVENRGRYVSLLLNDDHDYRLLCISGDKQNDVVSVVLPNTDSFWRLLGILEDGTSLCYKPRYGVSEGNNDYERIIGISPSGEISFSMNIEGDLVPIVYSVLLKDGFVYTLVSESADANNRERYLRIYRFDTKTWQKEMVYEEKSEDYSEDCLFVTGHNEYVISSYYSSTKSVEIERIDAEGNSTQMMTFSETEHHSIANRGPTDVQRSSELRETIILCYGTVTIYHETDGTTETLEAEDAVYKSILVTDHGTKLYLFDSEGNLALYNLAENELSPKTRIIGVYDETQVYMEKWGENEISILSGSGSRTIHSFKTTDNCIASVIPGEFHYSSVVRSYIGYNSKDNYFYQLYKQDDEYKIGCVPNYSLEDLIEMARERLKGHKVKE